MTTATRTREWTVRCPNEGYAGFTANVEFFRGKTVVDEQVARAAGYDDPETLVAVLVNDFGYTSEPPLPQAKPDARAILAHGVSLAERDLAIRSEVIGAAPGDGPNFCASCGTSFNGSEPNFCVTCGAAVLRVIAESNAATPEAERYVASPFPRPAHVPAGADEREAYPVPSHAGRDETPNETIPPSAPPESSDGDDKAATDGDTHG